MHKLILCLQDGLALEAKFLMLIIANHEKAALSSDTSCVLVSRCNFYHVVALVFCLLLVFIL